MFSLKRFDTFAEGEVSSSQPSHSSQSKLDALNERIAKKRKLAATQEQPSLTLPAAAATTTEEETKPVPAGLKIHPSRLNSAPILRAAVARATNGPREKTKAKQRYLKAKKTRRKAKKKSTPKSKAQDANAASDADQPVAFPDEDAHSDSSSSSSSSDSDSHSDSSHDHEADETKDDAGDAAADQGSISHSEEGQQEVDDDQEIEEEDGEPKTPDDEEQIDGLMRFPSAGRKQRSDPALIRRLGLPEGMSNRTVVDPTLSKPLTAPEAMDIGDRQPEKAGPGFANVTLSQSVKQQLESLGVSSWFAVQVSVIPSLLSLSHSRSLYRPHAPQRDICVSAPTGSGKTLAYSVPIIEVLRTRQIVRLRALIVLPTRDLVSQVRSTIELIAKGTGLKVGTATGHHSFSHEQGQIMGSDGSRPQVDILIATPGRLIDHLNSTPGFSLAHLRFMVIDEADRLLNQSFQEWLRKVLHATEDRSLPAPREEPLLDLDESVDMRTFQSEEAETPFQSRPVASNPSTDLFESVKPAVQKLLFSATLTRDPAKIAALGLRDPHYITIQDNTRFDGSIVAPHQTFSLPHSLHEHMLVTSSQDKPLRLLELVHRQENPIRKALVFTKSVKSAARLVKLIEFYEQVRGTKVTVRNYSSELKSIDRQRILTQFGQGQVDLLVCSDLISRGIDLPDVRHVISYDVPVDLAKYVHRVGRTARAGKEGDAWTLVEEQEARHFKRMMRTIIRQAGIDKVKVRETEQNVDYAEALKRLALFYADDGNA